jgi:flagellar hook-length control protein FliK
MPSLNLSSPGLPGLSAGMFPVASNQLPQVTAGGGGDFAAIMTPPDDDAAPVVTAFLDVAPVSPSGTVLPPVRQDVAGKLEPLPPTPVEDVMIGTLPPAPGMELDLETDVPPEQTADTPAPPASPPQIGECRIKTWDFHGASLRSLARGTLQPAKLQPVIVPEGETPDLVEPVVTDLRPAVTDEPAEAEQPKATAPDTPLPQPVPPPFAPIDWTRPPASLPSPAPASDTEDAAVGSPRPVPVAASLPAPAIASAKPAPEAILTLPPQPDGQPAQPQAQLQSQAQAQHTPPPQGFILPPEIAREVAEIVRAAVGDHDDAPASVDSADSAASAPQLQNATAPATSLHRDFVASHRPPIDTSRAEWMQSMIERIAEMPQADGKREAQLRLAPDALGTVNVRIEQRQDRLHVTMNSDNAQARQLLSEAAPRLQEMAEARGLRLGQTGIGGGESHDRRQTREQGEQSAPLRPRPAEAARDTSSEPQGDLIA